MGILHRKEKLIITTIEIIDELGIQKLSTREIARRQGVSEATLFRHFRTKNDLLHAVLDYYTKFDLDICESIKMKKLKPREAIFYYIDLYTEYYQNYPAITSIMGLSDVLRYEADLADKVKSIFYNRTSFIKELIEQAQESGDIRPDIDSENLAITAYGFYQSLCLKWRFENQGFSLKEKTLEGIEMILNAFG